MKILGKFFSIFVEFFKNFWSPKLAELFLLLPVSESIPVFCYILKKTSIFDATSQKSDITPDCPVIDRFLKNSSKFAIFAQFLTA